MLQHFRTARQTSPTIVVGLLGALLGGAVGCSDDGDWHFGQWPRSDVRDVSVVYDPDIDFSRYQSFAFRDDDDVDSEMSRSLSPAARRDLDVFNERIAIELKELGLTEVGAEDADLLAFSVRRTRSATGVTWNCVGAAWGGYWAWDYYYDPCAWLEPAYVQVDRTTVMVGLLDPELSEVTFAGFIRGLRGVPGNRARQIARAVDRVFARYPARPAGSVADAGLPDAGASDAASSDAAADDDAASDAGASPSALDAGAPLVDAGALDAGDLDAGDGGAPAP